MGGFKEFVGGMGVQVAVVCNASSLEYMPQKNERACGKNH